MVDFFFKMAATIEEGIHFASFFWFNCDIKKANMRDLIAAKGLVILLKLD